MKQYILAIMCLFILPYNFIGKTMAEQTSENKEFYVEDLNIALDLAKQTNQKVLLVLSSSWCGHCKNLKNDLTSIKGFEGKIICILDIDNNKDIGPKYGIKSLPTSIFLDNNGKELKRLLGYNKQSYEKWLKSIK